ncbi:hypothetical protein CBS147320_6547 [Aspergillus niger]|nr:hypothetical protein CBS11350_6797 [Aspergillus niger]KAI2843996.1 hypothetical protein CBS12448_10001 [Aspergillus niger]KAI2918892.1 hypothetical protein CBS147371_3970 [Aspergillus niger]KAI2924684.1 hypothetical protein CBS147320_6547 [Aspergillus niger]KAI2945680.1 hypothetical protein CBS147322_7557 [Aspergillus niger]
MRHFDTWILRDPYSIFHYYPTGKRWPESIRELIQSRQICSPPSSANNDAIPAAIPADNTSQPTSSFFQRLPPEIRLMIYAYVFNDSPNTTPTPNDSTANTTIHLVQIRNKIHHVRCTHPSPLDKHRQCCPQTMARWRTSPTTTTTTIPKPITTTTTITKGGAVTSPAKATDTNSSLYPHTRPSLPLTLSKNTTSPLLTCRAMYLESAPLLYSLTTIDTDDLYTFLSFINTISPHLRKYIKSLTVQYTPIWQPMAGQEYPFSVYTHTHNDMLWGGFWDAVARKCPGLERVRLGLDLGTVFAVNNNIGGGGGMSVTGGNMVSFGTEEEWVRPLLRVRGLKSFELGVMVRCDRLARRVLENGLVRDVQVLRERLMEVMCKERDRHVNDEEDGVSERRRGRLAIMAA